MATETDFIAKGLEHFFQGDEENADQFFKNVISMKMNRIINSHYNPKKPDEPAS